MLERLLCTSCGEHWIPHDSNIKVLGKQGQLHKPLGNHCPNCDFKGKTYQQVQTIFNESNRKHRRDLQKKLNKGRERAIKKSNFEMRLTS